MLHQATKCGVSLLQSLFLMLNVDQGSRAIEINDLTRHEIEFDSVTDIIHYRSTKTLFLFFTLRLFAL